MDKSEDPCLYCDCNDPDVGCTMPSVDKLYACPLGADEEELRIYKEDEKNEE